jgi:N-acylneuraminate cytidylyltransferase
VPKPNVLAVVPDREGRELAGSADTVDRVEVCEEPGVPALLRLLDALDDEPELLVYLPAGATAPTPEAIDGTVGALLAASADSAVAVEETGSDRTFVESGTVHVVRVPRLRAEKHLLCGRTAVYVTAASAAAFPDDIEAVVLDFDGVFTDNRVLVLQDGSEGVLCNRSDGLGLEGLRRSGIPVVVISKERNPVVSARCRKLGIECRQGIDEKTGELRRWLTEHGATLQKTVYVGNDVNDLGCMEIVGWPVAVADAFPEVRAAARVVLEKPGGQGALRELVERMGVREL